ncbi:MAG TPA: dipeptidyl aminopeptidase [Blastocatellia bacterium]
MSDSNSFANHTRRDFIGYTAFAALGAGARVISAEPQNQDAATASGPEVPTHFFADQSFDFTFQIALGTAYYRGANPGKILRIASQIKAGDSEGAYQALRKAGYEAQQIAVDCARRGHRVSAREAYLWAGNYIFASTYFLDGTNEPSRFLPTWKDYYACWEQAAALSDPPIERVSIPYEGTTLTGWFFRVDEKKKRRPLLILNNGSDGSEADMWVMGAAGGLARGYNCLTFDGPGQGAALWLQKLYFRPDWEKVMTPVVDFALKHQEVNPKQIALCGISQGGYWVPRALAFEHRIAAGIADPGVWDVSAPYTRRLPPVVVDMLHSGKKEQFDSIVKAGISASPQGRALLAFRMRPFGMSSYYDVFKAVLSYSMEGLADRIQCPMLVTNPESEAFFPGQPKRLFDALKCKKALVDFTVEDGASLHCEVNSPGYRDLRIFDWLDETLSHPGR